MSVKQKLLEKWSYFSGGFFIVRPHEGRMADVLPSALGSEASLKSPFQPVAIFQEGVSFESLIQQLHADAVDVFCSWPQCYWCVQGAEGPILDNKWGPRGVGDNEGRCPLRMLGQRWNITVLPQEGKRKGKGLPVLFLLLLLLLQMSPDRWISDFLCGTEPELFHCVLSAWRTRLEVGCFPPPTRGAASTLPFVPFPWDYSWGMILGGPFLLKIFWFNSRNSSLSSSLPWASSEVNGITLLFLKTVPHTHFIKRIRCIEGLFFQNNC